MKYILILLFIGCTSITEPDKSIPIKDDPPFGCPAGQYWDYGLEICIDEPYDEPEE